jgi:hypothetical protein
VSILNPLGAWLVAVPYRLLFLLIPLALVALLVLRVRAMGRPDRRVTALATVVGLGWSAQGMWDSAVHTYDVVPALAAVLFFMFEAFMVGNMLRAARYRTDRPRRARPVRFVWSLAVIMGVVVALAEGIEQAPLRLAVPLLVAWNWHLDLVADDDPAEHVATSWRWTPRRLGLALGLLEPGARDAVTIDRDRLTARLTALRFRQRYGAPWFGELVVRPRRIARLGLIADDEIVAESDARLARAARLFAAPEQPAPKSHPTMPDQPAPPVTVPAPKPEPKPAPTDGPPPRRPQGVHEIGGQLVRGPALRADAATRLMASVKPNRPRGMSAAELAALYTPPLGQRTAEDIAAEVRRNLLTNGHAFTPATD